VTEVERNEARFYTELASEVPFATPYCFYSAIDDAAGRAVLVLEDLRDLHACGDVRGIAASDAAVVIETLALFHARFWGKVERFAWVRDARTRAAVHEAWLAENLEGSLGLLRGCLDRERLRLCRSLAGTPTGIVQRLDAEPRTLVHMDYRADNLFLGEDGRVWLVDNGIMSRLRGPADLGCFYGTSLTNSVRRKHGERLLDTYVSALRRHGVVAYDDETFLRDLCLGVLRWLAYALALFPEPEVRTGRPRRILEAWIDRFTWAALELGAPAELR
jgi:hypothetical protein